MASWAEDQERAERYDEALRAEPGFMPDPKPTKRMKADVGQWREMLELLRDTPCQVCGVLRAHSFHHIVPKSQGGDDVKENLALLCGHGTVGCHGDVEARRNDARERLRENMTLEQSSYVMAKRGLAWLGRHYPLREES